jgi:hypothetical protein
MVIKISDESSGTAQDEANSKTVLLSCISDDRVSQPRQATNRPKNELVRARLVKPRDAKYRGGTPPERRAVLL